MAKTTKHWCWKYLSLGILALSLTLVFPTTSNAHKPLMDSNGKYVMTTNDGCARTDWHQKLYLCKKGLKNHQAKYKDVLRYDKMPGWKYDHFNEMRR